MYVVYHMQFTSQQSSCKQKLYNKYIIILFTYSLI